MQTPPDGDGEGSRDADVDLFDRKASRLAGRQVGSAAGGSGIDAGRSQRPTLAVAPEEGPDARLLARLAAMEDRLDRHSMAFGALCELVCEPLGITEADLARSIRRIAAEY